MITIGNMTWLKTSRVTSLNIWIYMSLLMIKPEHQKLFESD